MNQKCKNTYKKTWKKLKMGILGKILNNLNMILYIQKYFKNISRLAITKEATMVLFIMFAPKPYNQMHYKHQKIFKNHVPFEMSQPNKLDLKS